MPRVGVDDLVVMLSQATGGKFPLALTPDARLALGRAITAAGAIVQGESAFVALREYIERGMPGFPREILTPEQRTKGEISPDAVAAPGWLPLAVQRALTWKTETDAKIAELARLRADAGV